MSRGNAKEKFTVAQYEAEMAGIFSSTVNASTLDESPMAYKAMAGVLEWIEPTAKVLERIRPVYNFKAGKRTADI
jgi:RNA-splicing ligase RtcB